MVNKKIVKQNVSNKPKKLNKEPLLETSPMKQLEELENNQLFENLSPKTNEIKQRLTKEVLSALIKGLETILPSEEKLVEVARELQKNNLAYYSKGVNLDEIENHLEVELYSMRKTIRINLTENMLLPRYITLEYPSDYRLKIVKKREKNLEPQKKKSKLKANEMIDIDYLKQLIPNEELLKNYLTEYIENKKLPEKMKSLLLTLNRLNEQLSDKKLEEYVDQIINQLKQMGVRSSISTIISKLDLKFVKMYELKEEELRDYLKYYLQQARKEIIGSYVDILDTVIGRKQYEIKEDRKLYGGGLIC